MIVNVIGGYGLPDPVFRAFTEGGHVWLDELLRSLSTEMLTHARDRARLAGATTIQLDSRHGEVTRTLIDIARQKPADIIIVGKRGAGRIAGLLLGSVSQKLASLSPVPVTIVP